VVPHSALVVFAGVEKLLLVRDGKVHEQRVRTGQRIGERVEIVEGLSSGDMVITQPAGLADGAAVRAGS
jgi:multidrug efflux pump subunit AcrA (membrane-fusion protein)